MRGGLIMKNLNNYYQVGKMGMYSFGINEARPVNRKAKEPCNLKSMQEEIDREYRLLEAMRRDRKGIR